MNISWQKWICSHSQRSISWFSFTILWFMSRTLRPYATLETTEIAYLWWHSDRRMKMRFVWDFEDSPAKMLSIPFRVFRIQQIVKKYFRLQRLNCPITLRSIDGQTSMHKLYRSKAWIDCQLQNVVRSQLANSSILDHMAYQLLAFHQREVPPYKPKGQWFSWMAYQNSYWPHDVTRSARIDVAALF